MENRMEMKITIEERAIKRVGDVIIVINTDNYQSIYSEKGIFKAKITSISTGTIWVESLKTKKKYELYPEQILQEVEGCK